ncbi:MAG: DUF5615 family PIN-like protein [Ardenticatenaceae bacterium]|nr:DUF5615 family PIN-like protein [Ardenticatenaceae bacterium]
MNPEAPLFIRLSLDEDVHKRVAAALQLRHFDVVSAHELGTWGLSDEEQAAYAAREGRTILTYNTPDSLRLHQEWLQAGRAHWGIVVSDQLPIRETVHRLLNLLNRVTADEMQNEVRWLQAFKVP